MDTTVRRAADRADQELSLEIHNAVWPQHAATMDDVDSFAASTLAHADHVAFVGGEPAGAAFVAIMPSRPAVCYALTCRCLPGVG